MITLRLPIFGRLALVSNTCNFSQISSALLMSGVEVVESIRIAASVVKNNFLKGSITSSLDSVSQGSKLHIAFEKLHIFEPLFVSMVQIGVEASMLPDTFQKMADLYEAESNEATQKMTAVLEPIITTSIGLVIALLVISIILPMFDMYSVVLK